MGISEQIRRTIVFIYLIGAIRCRVLQPKRLFHRSNILRNVPLITRIGGLAKLGPVARTANPRATSSFSGLEYELDRQGRERLAYRENGWEKWDWRGSKINYIKSGSSGKPIVLVHGFGAHSYHWRYQFPTLSKEHRVYSLCLLGYGWSEKAPDAPYSPELWGEQIADFIRDIVGEKAVVVGNSIGAIASLTAAANNPDLVDGLVMINAAGKFGDLDPDYTGYSDDKSKAAADEEEPETIVTALKNKFQDLVAAGIFYSTRFRIPLILKQVYNDKEQVDEDLVKSIQTPATDSNALATFQSISRAPARTTSTVNELMARLSSNIKLLLLWGQQDPWMQPEKADQIMKMCDLQGLECEYVPLQAGHCPQDDNPVDVNENLSRWLTTFSE